MQENPLDDKNKNKCGVEKCFGGCFFNLIAYRVCADKSEQPSGKLTQCDSEVLTEKYNMKVDEQKRCFPVVALVVVSGWLYKVCYTKVCHTERLATNYGSTLFLSTCQLRRPYIELWSSQKSCSCLHPNPNQVLFTLGFTAFSASQVLECG